MTTRGAVRVAAAVAAVILLAACRPAVVLVGDPVFRASLHDPAELETRLREAVDGFGFTGRVVWPQPGEDAPLALPLDLGGRRAEIVVLSPLYALSVLEDSTAISGLSPETTLAGTGSAPPADPWNGVWVAYDAIPAYERAGRLAARWQSGDAERMTVLLVNERAARSEAQAFEAGFREQRDELGAGELRLSVERFRAAPTGQALSDAASRYPQGPDTLWVLLLGRADQSALTLLRAQDVRLGLRGVDPALDPQRVYFSVVDDLIAAAEALIAESSTRDGVIGVEAGLVVPDRQSDATR